jgi:hypothetical protein
MIQRIQSLYLLLALAATCFLISMPIATIYGEDLAFTMNAFVIKDITSSATNLASTLYIALSLIISAILSLATIFLYKKRNNQLKVISANIFMLMFALAMMYYIYPDLIIPKIERLAAGFTIDYNLWTFACIVPAFVFLFLANKAIKKDEKLVRAADRLR